MILVIVGCEIPVFSATRLTTRSLSASRILLTSSFLFSIMGSFPFFIRLQSNNLVDKLKVLFILIKKGKKMTEFVHISILSAKIIKRIETKVVKK